jgi:hypothetical protein
MGVVLVMAVLLGLYVRSVHVQQDAVAAIKRVGGSVVYDWEWDNYDPDIMNAYGKPRAPKWLANLVPVDYVANVVHVRLTPQRAKSQQKADDETLAHVGHLGRLENLSLERTAITDAGLAHLKGLTRLRYLWLERTAITDAGLAHLKGLTGLRQLYIDDTLVSDAGLAHLKGMTGLISLSITGSHVTDDGVLELERALPRLFIYRREENVSSNDATRVIDDLEYARSRPLRLASALLAQRARSMVARRDNAGLIATVDALCDLEADDKLSLLKLAEARAECLGILDPLHSPDLTASQRRSLQRRCGDRGVEALRLAIELGYDNVRRLEGDPREVRMLWNLHDHSAYPRLIAAMKAKHPGR